MSSTQPTPVSVQPAAGGTVKQEVNLQNHEHTFNGECHFCTIWGHKIPDCKTAATYVGAGKLFWGSDRHLYLPQGRKIHVTLTAGACSRALTIVTTPVAATTSATSSFVRDPPPHVTAGILSVTGPEIEVELEIESSAYMGTSTDYTWERGPDVDDPAFQPYVAAAWANFQNDMAGDRSGNRGKRVCFDGVEIPARPRPRPGPSQSGATQTTRQPKEILSPEVQAAAGQGVPRTAMPPALGATSGTTSRPDTSASRPPPAYSFPLEDETAPKQVLDRVLESTVPVPVKDLFAVSPDFWKQFRDMTTTKRVATGVVQDASITIASYEATAG
ncbi:hypothetical protein BU15DRAFT_67348 [Melanogaster broomeanus]|nr:hypothetical protein BU15DRAFT_67348 [Melanogaster broomeanus]